MVKITCISLLALGLAAAPVLAQNRFADEAKEQAARRAENEAVRKAEHPETTQTATTRQPDPAKPAGSQPPPSPTDAQPTAPAQPAAQ
jgi:hypothetical protein